MADTVLGYVFVVVSTILWAAYEVFFKKFGSDPAVEASVERSVFSSFLYLGLLGAVNTFVIWIGILVVVLMLTKSDMERKLQKITCSNS